MDELPALQKIYGLINPITGQFDYLIDKGYQLRCSSEAHWSRQHNEVGIPVEAYLLDDDLKVFDIGSY